MPENTNNQNAQALQSQYYTPADPGSPDGGGQFNYDAFLSKVGQQATATKNVYDPGLPDLKDYKNLYGEDSPFYTQLSQAYSEYGAQKDVKQQQADTAAEALQLRGEGFADYMRNIQAIQTQARGDVKAGKEAYGEATDQAEQYVKDAVARKEQVLATVSDLADEMMAKNDFSKAHAMQASVQASIGQYNQRERDVTREFGSDSAEYEQLQVEKSTNLGQMQSTLHASYQQLQDQLNTTILNTTSEAALKSDMYINFQEQQHVETMKAMAQMDQQYTMQLAQFEIGLEQMKMSGLDEMANWFTSTPAYAMDTQDIMSIIMTAPDPKGPAQMPTFQGNKAAFSPTVAGSYAKAEDYVSKYQFDVAKAYQAQGLTAPSGGSADWRG